MSNYIWYMVENVLIVILVCFYVTMNLFHNPNSLMHFVSVIFVLTLIMSIMYSYNLLDYFYIKLLYKYIFIYKHLNAHTSQLQITVSIIARYHAEARIVVWWSVMLAGNIRCGSRRWEPNTADVRLVCSCSFVSHTDIRIERCEIRVRSNNRYFHSLSKVLFITPNHFCFISYIISK